MTTRISPPFWFWIVAIVLTVWDAMGVYFYLDQVTMSEEVFATLNERMQTFLTERPLWGTAGFAIAVWGGLLASILLLLRQKLALIIYYVSLIGVLLSTASDFAGSLTPNAGELGFSVVIFVVSILSIWFARYAASKNWIR